MLACRIGTGMRFVAISVIFGILASCGTTKVASSSSKKRSKEYFAESIYGVKASARVVENGPVPKGGGREMVGKPYVVKGKRFVPKVDPNYNRVGVASWYGSAFHGRYTSNGEIYDKEALTAAHPTLPLPSYARVTNLENGSSIIVRINDRGPFEKGRLIDLSSKTAELLDMKHSGSAKVRVQYVGRARMDGLDENYLMASYRPNGNAPKQLQDRMAPNVMVADAGAFMPTASMVPAAAPVPVNASVYAAADTFPPVPVTVPLPGTLQNQALALNETGAAPEAFSAMTASFVILPEFGPYPAVRPAFMEVAGAKAKTYVSGYTSEVVVAEAEPFRAVLADNGELTSEMIRQAYNKRSTTQ